MGDGGTDWAALALAPGAELIVGWRPRRARLDAAAIELSRDVARELQAMCHGTLDQLAGLVHRPYSGSAYIEPGEEYLAVPVTELAGAAAHAPGSEDDEAAGLSDLHRLVMTPGLATLSRSDLREGRYLFYAVICTGQGTGQRIGFVRQTDPHRVAKAGGITALFGQEGLRRLEDPVFIFEAGFDLVIGADEVAVLRLEAFNRMFADLNALALAAPANARKIAGMVGQVTPAAIEALGRAAAARPSIARRLQRLARAGTLPSVTPKDLSRAMLKHELDPAQLVMGNKIAFEQDQATVFLDLIEQLYYETDFTGEHRRSDRYSPLKPQARLRMGAYGLAADEPARHRGRAIPRGWSRRALT